MAIQPVGGSSGGLPAPAGSGEGSRGFVDEITRMIQSVNQDQAKASGAIEQLVVEGEGSIHDAMIAMSKAEGSFRLLMAMRNRLVDAVNQLLQTQV
jgi:flagellar hook-basal body complex protein FliE